MEKKYKCTICKYEWVPKSDNEPKRCPNCGSKHITDIKRHFRNILGTEGVEAVE